MTRLDASHHDGPGEPKRGTSDHEHLAYDHRILLPRAERGPPAGSPPTRRVGVPMRLVAKPLGLEASS